MALTVTSCGHGDSLSLRAPDLFYDARGGLKATQYPNGTFSWADFNPLGELTGLYNRHDSTPLSAPLPSSVPADSNGSPLVDYSYSYTPDGQISEEIRTGGGLTSNTTDFSYDNLGRLDQVVLPDGSCRDYSYDLDSNRTQTKQAGSGCSGSFITTASYTYDPATTPGLDELTSQTGPTRSFAYNTDGAMTGRGSDSLSWDGWGRNTGGTYSATTISYSYDPAGNQASRNSGSQTTNYLYGGSQNPIFETDSGGTITLSYIQGPGGDLAHYAGPPTTSSTLSYLYPNGHGDLAATADTSGNRTNNYTYDPFGTPDQSVPSNTTTQRWTGSYDKQLDTTSNLIQMGARPYDPTLGRFTTVDPIDGGSLNPYDYADQDPINNYDLSGLYSPLLCDGGPCNASHPDSSARGSTSGSTDLGGSPRARRAGQAATDQVPSGLSRKTATCGFLCKAGKVGQAVYGTADTLIVGGATAAVGWLCAAGAPPTFGAILLICGPPVAAGITATGVVGYKNYREWIDVWNAFHHHR